MNPEASKARRCLFGRPDHQELENDLQRELDRDAREMSEKWEFDFKEEKPLEGTRFQWEKVNEPPKEKGEQPKDSAFTDLGNKEMTEKKSTEEHLHQQKTPPKNPR